MFVTGELVTLLLFVYQLVLYNNNISILPKPLCLHCEQLICITLLLPTASGSFQFLALPTSSIGILAVSTFATRLFAVSANIVTVPNTHLPAATSLSTLRAHARSLRCRRCILITRSICVRFGWLMARWSCSGGVVECKRRACR